MQPNDGFDLECCRTSRFPTFADLLQSSAQDAADRELVSSRQPTLAF
jgi:hypothetical protein